MAMGILALAALSCSKKSEISILQDGKEYALSAGAVNRLALAKKPFAIRAKVRAYDEAAGRFYALKAIATENDALFGAVSVGDAVGDDSPFGPGKGLAIDARSSSLFVADDAYNYLYYEPANADASPFKPVGEENGAYRVEALIIGLNEGERRNSVETWDRDTLDLILFYDADLDDAIESGELAKVAIAFRRSPQ
jgi:hypothetical protein